MRRIIWAMALCLLALTANAEPLRIKDLNPDQRIYYAQILLKRGGYAVGSVDGDYGKKTRAALDNFREDQEFYSRILKPLSGADLGALRRAFGEVDSAELPAFSNASSGCIFKRGDRVRFIRVTGRHFKTEKAYYATFIALKKDGRALVEVDGVRVTDSNKLSRIRGKRTHENCQNLSRTKY